MTSLITFLFFTSEIMCALSDVRAVSISYSGIHDDPLRRDEATFCKSQGALLFNSAGNNGANLGANSVYPTGDADLDDIIAVGSTTSSDAKSSFSAYGTLVDLYAPGSSVYTTMTGNGYTYISGTSFSCPLAAGLAALIWSANPLLTPDEVKKLISGMVAVLLASNSLHPFLLLLTDVNSCRLRQ